MGKNILPKVITAMLVTYMIYLNVFALLNYKKRVEPSKRGSSPTLPLFTFNELVATKAGSTTSRAR